MFLEVLKLCNIPPVELAKTEFHVEKREASEHQHGEVWYQEGPWFDSNLKRTQKLPFSLPERIMTSSVGVADVRKAPNISEVDGKANLCRNILHFFACIIANILHFSHTILQKEILRRRGMAYHGEEELDLLAPHLPHLSLDDHLWFGWRISRKQKRKVKSGKYKWKVLKTRSSCPKPPSPQSWRPFLVRFQIEIVIKIYNQSKSESEKNWQLYLSWLTRTTEKSTRNSKK